MVVRPSIEGSLRLLPLALVVLVLAAAGACSGDGGAKPGPGGTGGAGRCVDGFEACPCYGNHTCQSGLTCVASDYCVNLGGAGGGIVTTGSGGAPGSGAGGAPAEATGGTPAPAGTGGAPAPAGTGGAAAGTGGAPAGGGTGGSAGTPCQPSCLVHLLGGCAPSGACVYSTGLICYANGVKYSTSGTMTTVIRDGAICSTVGYTGNTPGGQYLYTYRAPDGSALGTLVLCADGTQIVMCPGQPDSTIPASCSSSVNCMPGACS